MFVVLDKSLEGVDTFFLRRLAYCMNNRRYYVMGAPNSRGGYSYFIPKSYTVHSISLRALNGCNIEAECVLRLERATDMELSIAAAEMAWHTSTTV